MSTPDLVLGIDLGTSSVKVGVVDDRGRLHAFARRQHSAPRPDRQSGQNPEQWWQACRLAMAEAVSRLDPGRIGAICAVGLAPSLTAIDATGTAVGAAPIWSDRVAAEEAGPAGQKRRPAGRPAGRTAGRPEGRPAKGQGKGRGADESIAFPDALAHLVAMQRFRPDSYRRIRWALQSYEFLAYRLSAEVATIVAYPDCPVLSPAELNAHGLDPDILPPRRCQPGEVLGPVSPHVAAELGLRRAIPVVAGTIDSFAAWLGAGSLDNGDLCISLGTTSCAALVCDRQFVDPLNRVGTIRHLSGDGWVLTGPMSSGGSFLDWVSRGSRPDGRMTPGDLCAAAGGIPMGADGLVALPYLLGERSPVRDPDATGVVFGLRPWHTPSHLARAALESIAFQLGQMCAVFVELGAPIDSVRLTGRLASSPVWAGIVADVLGATVLAPSAPASATSAAAATSAATTTTASATTASAATSATTGTAATTASAATSAAAAATTASASAATTTAAATTAAATAAATTAATTAGAAAAAEGGLVGAAALAYAGVGRFTTAIEAARSFDRSERTQEPDLAAHLFYTHLSRFSQRLYHDLQASFRDLVDLQKLRPTARPGHPSHDAGDVQPEREEPTWEEQTWEEHACW